MNTIRYNVYYAVKTTLNTLKVLMNAPSCMVDDLIYDTNADCGRCTKDSKTVCNLRGILL